MPQGFPGGYLTIFTIPRRPQLTHVLTGVSDLSGTVISTTTVSSNTADGLDDACRSECDRTFTCHAWVREAGDAGEKECVLKTKITGALSDDSKRGGWRQMPCQTLGDAVYAKDDIVHITTIYGGSDSEMDAGCRHACTRTAMCEVWVRESGDYGYKLCWLLKNIRGTVDEQEAPTRRGGWKYKYAQALPSFLMKLKSAATFYTRSASELSTFDDMDGYEIGALSVTGSDEHERDMFCLQACSMTPACEFWVREKSDQEWVLCWLKKHPAQSVKNDGRRGGYISTHPPLELPDNI